jgi:hypothetical protein
MKLFITRTALKGSPLYSYEARDDVKERLTPKRGFSAILI